MKKSKINILIIFLMLGIPLLYGLNKLLIGRVPKKHLLPNGQLNEDGFYWVISWSASLSLVVAFILLALIYRFWISKNNH